MEYQTRRYPLFSACGLNCALCPRFHTAGSSRCPGCAGEGFSAVHPSCGILSCCQRKGIEYCFQCDAYPCKKYNGADLADSFITHRNQFRDMESARQGGMDAYATALCEKAGLLNKLLKDFDDGRRKGFYCAAVNLLDLQDVKDVVSRIEAETKPETAPKDKAAAAVRLFEQMAGTRGISLKLRKRAKPA